ncbi:MAG: hypothetical protein ACE15D_19045 [Candidatus Eisenbacteria bacterium]|nr:hypothetical protein [Candidatus Eisenbacteria bacterium]
MDIRDRFSAGGLAIGILCLFCTIALPAMSRAEGSPDPLCCWTSLDEAQRLLLYPFRSVDDPGFATFTVIVRDNDCQPVANALVEILPGGLTEGRVHLCDQAITSSLTNSQGSVRMSLPGSGCMKGPDAVVIRANNVVIRMFETVVSTDYAGHDNVGLPNLWDENTSLIDFAAFAQAFRAGGPSCHDYDNDGRMSLADLTIFAQVYLGPSSCH